MRVPHANIGDRLAALFALVEERHVGAHLAQRHIESGPCLVDENAFDRHLGLGRDQRGCRQKGSRTRIARHGQVAALQLGAAAHRDGGAPIALRGEDLGAEVAQHAFGVIPRRLSLDDRRFTARAQPGQKHG